MFQKRTIVLSIVGISCIISVIVIIVSLVRVFTVDVKTGIGCNISLKGLSVAQPLILRPEGGDENDAFLLPNNNSVVTLSHNQLVDLYCPNNSLVFTGININSESSTPKCSFARLSTNEHSLFMSEVACNSTPYHTARYTGNQCLNRHREIEIGFVVGERFLRHILICFDECRQSTLYSRFNLSRAIAGAQVSFPRANWTQGDFYDLDSNDLNTLYTIVQQRITINKLLGLELTSEKYIAESNDSYLSRGHLTAKTDFIYGSQHNLTFYFVNAAPQWQLFNGGNWNSLESDVRNIAINRTLDLVVYTGTYGVTTLPHEITGENVTLFLYVNDYNRGIPVPRLFWKVVYEPVTKAGVVFIGVNNPYVFYKDKDIICTDICSRYNWLSWAATNVTYGYSYCCSVEDFRKTVTTLPEFAVVQILE